MPAPETCAPAACAKASGAATVIVALPLPPVMETTKVSLGDIVTGAEGPCLRRPEEGAGPR